MSAADKMAAKAWAVVSRWQSPNWVSAEGRRHTGDLIEELADAAREYEAEKAQPAPELSMLPSGNVLLRCADCVAYDPDATCRVCRVCRLFVPKGRADAQPADRVDAERYRWLRDDTSSDWAICEWSSNDSDGIGYYRDARAASIVDAAIDAAMLAARAEKGGAL